MPQSKKDLRAQKQRANIKAGIGDEKGRIASNQKVKLKLVLNIIFSVMGFQDQSLKRKKSNNRLNSWSQTYS